MSIDSRQFILTPVPPRAAAGIFAFAARTLVTAGVLLILAFGAYTAWKWVDGNLLSWGIEDDRVTVIDGAQIVERIRAFEVVTVKHTYETSTSIDVSKALNAGPARFALPGWVAGQEMNARGQVEIAAGVDLSALSVDDVTVVNEGGMTRVVVRIPAPELLARQLLYDTMDLDTSQGVLTRLKTRLGLSETDLRDQAADRLAIAAETSAVENGILSEAGVEAKTRLEAFLNTVAATHNVTYVVEVVDAPLS